ELSPSVFCKVEVVPPEAALREAEDALAAGDAARGRRLLDQLLRGQPDFRPAWLSAAGWHYRQGQYGEALTHYERAFALGPGSARDYFQAGRSAARLKQHARAAELVRRGLAQQPERELLQKMQFNLGCYLAQAGDAEGAVRSLGEAVRAGLTD